MKITDRTTLLAIAVGGVLGAALRWLLARPESTTGGWFAYAPDSAVTVGTEVTGFEPVEGSGSQVVVVWPNSATLGGIPVGTLVANLLGCLLLGGLTLLLVRSTTMPRRLLVGAATGFCGSLTTFSSFAAEIAVALRGRPPSLPVELVEANAQFSPAYANALVYLVLSLGGGALAFWLGRMLVNRTVPT